MISILLVRINFYYHFFISFYFNNAIQIKNVLTANPIDTNFSIPDSDSFEINQLLLYNVTVKMKLVTTLAVSTEKFL